MSFTCCQVKRSKKDLNLKRIIDFLQVIAEPNRLKILCILRKKGLCVCDIWGHLDLPQNLVSHHLKVLKDHKLVSAKRESTKIIYTINTSIIDEYISLLKLIIK